MSDMQFSQLSKSELEEVHEAQRQIAQAERRLAEVVLKHLHVNAGSDIGVVTNAEIRIIRCGGKVCGIYKDPPGICVAVS